MTGTKRNYSEITPEIEKLARLCESDTHIEPEMYIKYNVYRGLRDLNGKGVLTGLTEISEIHAKDIKDGVEVPSQGKLYCRGYDIEDIVRGYNTKTLWFRGSYLFTAVRRTSVTGRSRRVLFCACRIPFAADVVRSRPYYESAKRKYDEFNGAQRPYDVFI